MEAPPVVGPNPGSTPSIKPNNVPNTNTIISFEFSNGANIKERFSIINYNKDLL